MDGAEEDGWSAVAAEWSDLWAASAAPAHDALIAASGIRAGSRVLDVGCGSGEFLGTLERLGATGAGVDPAPGMVALARATAPLADIRVGGAESLPWPDGSFDVVVAINALQFAEDTVEALAEFRRVLVPGGLVAVANWAEGARNDLDAIEEAVAAADGEEAGPDGDLRVAGGLEEVLVESGLEVVTAGLVEVPWTAADDETLVRGVLLGADPETKRELAPAVLAAAARFRSGDGYMLHNAYRFAVARRPD
ncbi:class I SAM-dependent methyltransferase [Conyzicola sp.]|uniref:class I SAM-dependent methyltransferase n=1 Tax=Conyzicola sp. TaxID=1969404 RepID=UPI003988E239